MMPRVSLLKAFEICESKQGKSRQKEKVCSFDREICAFMWQNIDKGRNNFDRVFSEGSCFLGAGIY